MSGTAPPRTETMGARRRRGAPPEGSGRLVRWPVPGSEGESCGLTLVDEPELVRALDQLGAAMAVAYHGSWGAACAPAAARAGTDRKVLAACHELGLIAEFLEVASVQGGDSAALAELAKGKASELRDVVEELEAAVARGNVGAT